MNSPAIGHSKKYRQSQPVVSWLREAVKEWHGTMMQPLADGIASTRMQRSTIVLVHMPIAEEIR
jgi:hypothetical protein